jgi:hypothetical protein
MPPPKLAHHGAATGLRHGSYGLVCIDAGPVTLSGQVLESIRYATQKRHSLPFKAVG